MIKINSFVMAALISLTSISSLTAQKISFVFVMGMSSLDENS